MSCSSAEKEQILKHLRWNYSRSFYEREGELVVFLNKAQMKYLVDLVTADLGEYNGKAIANPPTKDLP